MIKQSSCPHCPSSDAYTEYDDGSSYCFSCKKYTPPIGIKSEVIKQKLDGSELRSQKEFVYPSDATSYIPSEPLKWLHKYGITKQEIIKNGINWSDYYSGIILPCFNGTDRVLSGFTVRFFPRQNPKTIVHGFVCPSLVHDLHTSSIVLVEDYLSAIKVGRHVSTMCLWGSNIPLKALSSLSKRFSRVGIWLDMDKAEYSLRTARKASVMFKDGCTSILTELDPKCYEDKDIVETLRRHKIFLDK